MIQKFAQTVSLIRTRLLAFMIVVELVLPVCAESLKIIDSPARLPRNTGLGEYSPILRFGYSGLGSGRRYVMKVWLLSVGSWLCASTQWCERQFSISNVNGTNTTGEIALDAPFDVYDYALFDWVARLYDEKGTEVAFVERYTQATGNHPPALACIGDRTGLVGETIHLQLAGVDPDGDAIRFAAERLPPEAKFDPTTGTFDWTPTRGGDFQVDFSVVDSGAAELRDSEIVSFRIRRQPTLVEEPIGRWLDESGSVQLSARVLGDLPIAFQWLRNEQELPGATNVVLQLTADDTSFVWDYRLRASNPFGAILSRSVSVGPYTDRSPEASAEASLEHLRQVMDAFHNRIPIYDDLGSAGNHFHARGKIPSDKAPVEILGAWTENSHSGATCIRCSFYRSPIDPFGGFYFLNGILGPGTRAPSAYFGQAQDTATGQPVNGSTGMDLSGAVSLSFWARGQRGGETIDFFFGGVGWNPERDAGPIEPYPDSMNRYPPLGVPPLVLTASWRKYEIILTNLPPSSLTNIMGGFAWNATAVDNPDGAVFYLDDIQFDLNADRASSRLSEPRFLRSFTTESVQNLPAPVGDFDFVLRNAAVVYDNALALLAFLASSKSDDLRRARLIGDAFLYALSHDRSLPGDRVRNFYAAGDISLPRGWTPNGREGTVPIPGFYDEKCGEFFELSEAYKVDTGNNAWVIIALLGLHERTGQPEYLEAAKRIGTFLRGMQNKAGLYPGYQGGIDAVEATEPVRQIWSSSEHNLDVYAAFRRMAGVTGDATWEDDALLAFSFVESMWEPESGCFGTGTTDLNTRNTITNRVPLDVQAWSILAAPKLLEGGRHPLACAEAKHLTTEYGFTGFDFNDDRDGVWFEGTAQVAVSYSFIADTARADFLRRQLRKAQVTVPFGDGFGHSASTRNGLSTGFLFSYFRRLHVGATAWNVFAQTGFNPYYQIAASALPSLVIRGPTEDAHIEVSLVGASGLWYSLEDSVDLVSWKQVIEVRLQKSPQEVSSAEISLDRTRFYRARLLFK